MQLRYWKNIAPAVDGMQKIAAVTWSPNGKKLAVATSDRIVHLFDENGEKKERFPTKPSDKGQKSYIIRGLEFSPDSTKIAVAQSDNIVFVYKLGTDWGEKKSICNKFPTTSSVTCMTWPKSGDVIFGLAEGKVRVGFLKNNKGGVLYSTDSYVVALASSRDGRSVVSGHLDGSVYVFNIEGGNGQKIINYNSIPYGLAWGESIVCAGLDGKVAFYDSRGNLFQKFDYSNDDKVKDFTQAASNPSGETIVLGNFNRFYIYNYNSRRGQWEEIGVKNIENYYSVTALAWKQDGSKLVTGSLCGSVDLFDASMKKIKYKGKFEFNYVAPNQVIVKTLADGSRCVVKTKYAPEISKINIHQDRYVVANTYDSLLLGDLATAKISEIQWKGSGNEKYDFSNPNVCMIINAGELILVEYGNDDILGTARTEHIKPHLISARLSYIQNAQGESTKMIAYLLDNQTITIQDLNTSSFVATISHDQKIDFLELNSHANKLLFRDKRKQLYLYNIKDQVKNTLLSYCNYAQWVPNSEVVVAQNRSNLCVWYSIENPDKVAIYSIKGDVETIERTEGKTEVIVNDGGTTAGYTLDEPLIEFGFAIEARDLVKAMEILDPLEMTPETEANWKTLAKVALEEQNIVVAERCYSALGDIARSSYLHKILKMMDDYKKQTGKENGLEYYKAQAHLAILEKQLYKAETIFLNQNEDEEAMEMYQELHKWTESIKIAEKRNHPDVKDFKANYFKWLIDTNQEGKAAEMKENEGDYEGAIDLYLKGGLPAKAAFIASNYAVNYSQDLLEKIATTLIQAGMHEKAGEFYEKLEMLQKALNSYCEGNAFKKAVDLARKAAPALVAQLEERWGDWLVSQRQTENAINHYKEANQFQKAIEAAIQARQWNISIQLLQNQPPEVSRPFYKQVAKHYADVKQYDLAEKYYVKAGAPVEAFELYIRVNKWELAFKIARENLPESEIVQLYARIGQKFAEEGHYKEAERLFMEIQEPDLAINMYKKAGQYDNMIRLVSKFRKNLLRDTHLSIAQKLEREGTFKQAEYHYTESGAWHGAVEMYKNNAMWEDAIRVCRINGTDKETSELAKRWAESLGPDVGMKMLLKMNLVDAVIEYLTDRNEFQEAFKMAQQNAKHKIRDVHLKYALFLEDEKRYKEAEEEFIKAGKPAEAISMYEHQGDWHSALQVARQYDPQNVAGILLNQGKFFLERRDYAKAEQCYIQAKKPDLAIKMYTEMGQHTEALRVAKKHAPNLVEKINRSAVSQNQGVMSGDQLLQSAKLWEESRDWGRAIETYLEIRKEHFDDPLTLKDIWERAIQVARVHDKSRLQDVVVIISKRLWEIRQHEAAAEKYEDIGMYEEAVECLLDGELFDRAKGCVAQIRDPGLANRLKEQILNAQKMAAGRGGQGSDLVNLGEVDKGIAMMIEQGNWDQALKIAEQQSPQVLTKYLMRYAKVMMESGRFGETIAAFAQYGLPKNPNFYAAYKTLTLEIFAECDPKELRDLRKALYDLVESLEETGEGNTPAGKEFTKYLTVAHLLNLKPVLEKKNLERLTTDLSISLLRYSDLVRIDKLYYEAGMNAKKQNLTSTAFLILNRYLDIYEAIEDPDGNNLEDNPDFASTDFPSPFGVPLPEKNLISEQEKQKISDWLVEVSLKHKKEHSFDTKTCEVCKNKIADSCITCPKCKTQSALDIITGYPVDKNEIVPCASCRKPATKENWQEYLQNFANCPWCNNLPN